MSQTRKLRMGMVGGGPGAFIGPVHKMAAELDGSIELVAGLSRRRPSVRASRARVTGSIQPARTRVTRKCWRRNGSGPTPLTLSPS